MNKRKTKKVVTKFKIPNEYCCFNVISEIIDGGEEVYVPSKCMKSDVRCIEDSCPLLPKPKLMRKIT